MHCKNWLCSKLVTPRGHKHRVKEGDGAIPLLDDRVEDVVGFTVEYNRRAGFRLDVDFIELRLSASYKRGQLVGGEWLLDLFLEAMLVAPSERSPLSGPEQAGMRATI
jgi:hypothetical protein